MAETIEIREVTLGEPVASPVTEGAPQDAAAEVAARPLGNRAPGVVADENGWPAGSGAAALAVPDASEVAAPASGALDIQQRTAQHPCFQAGCTAQNSRIHLAVAPRCNISCNYCVRKHDCVNESRPGVTSKVLNAQQAFERFSDASERLGNLTVVGIAGPGDALANWEATRDTLRLIRQHDKNVTFCLSTNGLRLPEFADELADLGVTHVTVTLNTVDPAIGARMYKHVLWQGRVLEGREAAERLLANQLEGIRRVVARGLVVKINTVLVRGVNDDHASEVARVAAELGAYCQNITRMIPVPGSVFQDIEPVTVEKQLAVRAECAQYLPQIAHCRQCRADAVGKLTEDLSKLFDELAAGRQGAPRNGGRVQGTDPAATEPESAANTATGVGAVAAPTEEAATTRLKTAISEFEVAVAPAAKQADSEFASSVAGSAPNPASELSGGGSVSLVGDVADASPVPVDRAAGPSSGRREQALSASSAPSPMLEPPARGFVRVAVASRTGELVDQHFGHAERFLVYDTDGDDLQFREERPIGRYCDGPASCGQAERARVLQGALRAVSDCRAVLVQRVGPGPRQQLERQGVRVFAEYERVDDAVLDAYDELTA